MLAIVLSLPDRAHGQATTNVWGASSGVWTNAAAWASNGVPLTNVTTNGSYSIARFTNTSMVTVSNALGASTTARQVFLTNNVRITFDANGGFFGFGNTFQAQNTNQVVFTNGGFALELGAFGYQRNAASVVIGGSSTVLTNASVNSNGTLTSFTLNFGYSSGSGTKASNNQLRVVSGADLVFNASGSSHIGWVFTNNSATRAESVSNSITVSGAGSLFTNSSAVNYVGRLGSTTSSNDATTNALVSGNRLVVEDSGSAVLNGIVYVGFNASTNASSIMTDNSIEVGTGGSLQADRAYIGWSFSANTTSNRMTLSGGSINLTNTTDALRVFAGAANGNSLEVSGGTLTASAVSIGQFGNDGQANLKMDGGTVNVATLTIAATYGRFADATAQAGFNGGTLNVSNLVHERADLFTLGDGTGTVATLNLLGGRTNQLTAGLLVNSDGVLSGNGVIAANTAGTSATAVRNSGTISAGAGQTLRVVGSLTNQSGSTLSVSNGGAFIASAASTNAGTVNIGSGSSATFSNGLSSAGS
ncbi:MAG: beta strand repeat-containing protein, partial [Sphaerospermopsis kisseleviana]